MTYFASFEVPTQTGFRVLAGRRDGLKAQIHTPTPWNAPPHDGVYTSEEELVALRRRLAVDI